MIKTRLKYCVYDEDPRGNPRYYVRKPGRPKVRIREPFLDVGGNISEAFMAAYFAAIDQLDGKLAAKPTPREDTFDWLVDQYLRSDHVKAMDAHTQRDKRGVLQRFCDGEIGGKRAGELPFLRYRQTDVIASRDKRKTTPGAADKLVKNLRALFAWAKEEPRGYVNANPADGVKKVNRGAGWHTWSEAEVERYRAHWPLGSRARLALELMLGVGARRSDVVRLGPQHRYLAEDGTTWHRFTAWKNRNSAPVQIDAPITARLQEALDATATGHLAYLVTEQGAAFSIAGFGNKMRSWCDAAGLPNCSAHGLRKASASAFAEDGAGAVQLMALFGWTRIETAEVYVRAANKRRLVAGLYNLNEVRHRKSVSLPRTKTTTETNRRKTRAKSTPQKGGGGPTRSADLQKTLRAAWL